MPPLFLHCFQSWMPSHCSPKTSPRPPPNTFHALPVWEPTGARVKIGPTISTRTVSELPWLRPCVKFFQLPLVGPLLLIWSMRKYCLVSGSTLVTLANVGSAEDYWVNFSLLVCGELIRHELAYVNELFVRQVSRQRAGFTCFLQNLNLQPHMLHH